MPQNVPSESVNFIWDGTSKPMWMIIKKSQLLQMVHYYLNIFDVIIITIEKISKQVLSDKKKMSQKCVHSQEESFRMVAKGYKWRAVAHQETDFIYSDN